MFSSQRAVPCPQATVLLCLSPRTPVTPTPTVPPPALITPGQCLISPPPQLVLHLCLSPPLNGDPWVAGATSVSSRSPGHLTEGLHRVGPCPDACADPTSTDSNLGAREAQQQAGLPQITSLTGEDSLDTHPAVFPGDQAACSRCVQRSPAIYCEK